MYLEQPYSISQRTPPFPYPSVRPVPAPPNRRFRLILFAGIGLCGLVIVAVLISLVVLYFVRYRDAVSGLLPYPDFVCSQRPCGCPNYYHGKTSTGKNHRRKEVLPSTYPWLVVLTERQRRDAFCSAFLIAPNVILTAAHCLKQRNPYEIQIVARTNGFDGERYDIDQWFIHPEYSSNFTYHLNDIALIKIKSLFSSSLRLCCLPSIETSIYPRPKTRAIITRWTNSPSISYIDEPFTVEHVVIPIVDQRNSKCRRSLIDINRQICVVDDYHRLNGDSGSPLVIVEYDQYNQGHFVATGIVSYRSGQCASSISCGVYTRVGFYLPWIQYTLSNV